MVALLPPPIAPADKLLRRLLGECRAPKLRTMGQFALDEIVIPTGPFEGMRLRHERQPFVRLFHRELDRRKWSKKVCTGPRQTGKSLWAFVIPICYHLFERRETVIAFVHDDEMACIKWSRDILPVILRTRYAELLPDRGEGSGGGSVTGSVTFKNGSILKFMTVAGRPKSRQGYTARVLIGTEIDASVAIGPESVEGTPLEQAMHCTDAYGDDAEFWGECTVTVASGEVWKRYQAGTASQIRYPCPHCHAWVRPEREHLKGWQDALDVIEARLGAHFVCPACEEPIDEPMREAMLYRGVLVHRGETARTEAVQDDGRWDWRRWSFGFGPEPRIDGQMAATDTFGFRWSAFDNKFAPAAKVAEQEWTARRSENEDANERSLCQYTWAIPYKPPIQDNVILIVSELAARQTQAPRGIVPAGTIALTAGFDLAKRLANYIVIAWQSLFRGWIIDYGKFEVHGHTMAPDLAVTDAMRRQRDKLLMGYQLENGSGRRIPDCCFADSRWCRPGLVEFLQDKDTDDQSDPWRRRWWLTEGYGEGQYNGEYTQPAALTKRVVLLGDAYHFVRDDERKVTFCAIDADEWKSRWHHAISLPRAEGQDWPAGSVTLFAASIGEHFEIARHWTAEKQVTVAHPEKGNIQRWIRIGGRPNHYLDVSALSMCAAHFCGIRYAPKAATAAVRAQPSREVLTMPDGRPFYLGER